MSSFFYSIELTYYSTFHLCEGIINRFSFNVHSFNKQERCTWVWPHMFTKWWQQKSTNQLSFYPLMPQHLSITLNNTIHHFNVSLSQSFFQCNYVCNKRTLACEGPNHPSNQPHTGIIFLLQVHLMAKCIIKLCSELIGLFLGELIITPGHHDHMVFLAVNGLMIVAKKILCTVTQSIKSPANHKCKQYSLPKVIFNQSYALDYWCAPIRILKNELLDWIAIYCMEGNFDGREIWWIVS